MNIKEIYIYIRNTKYKRIHRYIIDKIVNKNNSSLFNEKKII